MTKFTPDRAARIVLHAVRHWNIPTEKWDTLEVIMIPLGKKAWWASKVIMSDPRLGWQTPEMVEEKVYLEHFRYIEDRITKKDFDMLVGYSHKLNQIFLSELY